MPRALQETFSKLGEEVKKILSGDAPVLDDLGQPIEKRTEDGSSSPIEDIQDESSITHALAGKVGALQGFHFPMELIGGCCPRVVGEEENIVWNAAAETADSERVHVVWQARGDKIWYLAVRSSDLASHPNTWCPFASFLPGQKDSVVGNACYTYYSDEAATMMTITEDSLQIHRGTASVLHVKSERTVRELGENVLIKELTPDVIESLTPVPWYSLSLFEDRARRILAVASVAVALIVVGVAVLVWLLASMAVITARVNLEDVQQRTQQKSMQLMSSVQTLRASTMREQLARFAEVNDNLLNLNGYLDFYQILSGKVLWRATIPSNVTSNRISEIGGQTLDTTPQGVVIGNNREALGVKKVR